MNVLLGVGNRMHGDDGVGPYVAERFSHPGWKAIDCGTVPENYTGVVKKLAPDIVAIVDAADMGLAPGERRIIKRQSMGKLAISTHSMPLSILMEYLEPHCREIHLIGIQPKGFEAMSKEVRKAADSLIERLCLSELEVF